MTASTNNDEQLRASRFCQSYTKSLIEIEDMVSTTHQWVNDDYISAPCVLNDGDIIKIGSVHFKYFAPGDREKVFHDKLYRAATIDEKTTYNNKYFRTQLSLLSNRAYQISSPPCLIMYDLDHFKKVNDTYDHLVGDYVSKQTAEAVRSVLRKNDVFARFGGEEFVVILPDTELGNGF